MDQPFNYILELFKTSSFLSDYGAHIFVCVLLLFGFLTYFFSIKPHQPTFESSKNVKRRVTKDKNLKNKDDSDFPSKPEVSNVIHKFKSTVDEYATEVLSVENDDDELWIPVQKPKKVSKNEKQITKKPSMDTKDQLNKQSEMQPSIKSNIVSHKESQSKPKSVNEIKETGDVNIRKEISKKPVVQKSKEVPVKMNKESEREVETKIEVDNSESPTSSSADDFVLVSSCKTLSSNDLAAEANDDTFTETRGTSGASRKKNKKQHKVISKQLIEAAIMVESDRKVVGVEELKVTTTAKKGDNLKKKRPRKDN